MEVRRLTNLARLMATVLAGFALPSTMLKVRQLCWPGGWGLAPLSQAWGWRHSSRGLMPLGPAL